MRSLFRDIRHRLVSKLLLAVGLTLLFTIATWAFFNIRIQQREAMANVVASTNRLTTTIRQGTHYAMMLNSRGDIDQIITNIARQKDLERIRIVNKAGEIKFSSHTEDVDRIVPTDSLACSPCHRYDPPRVDLPLAERVSIVTSAAGHRQVAITTAIPNEPGCATAECHYHPPDDKVLGSLDVVVSLEATDRAIVDAEKRALVLAGATFLITATVISVFMLRFVNRPIRRLIQGTWRISTGDYDSRVAIDQSDELGQLALAINRMGQKIGANQAELNRQRDEYQRLFEQVPCLITVQDRQFKLLRYNREFAERFNPRPGDYCYRAYKGRSTKCPNCPVEKTFIDGRTHFGEETGASRDGSPTHWIYKTSPITDADGEVVAAMEISIDITFRKLLEERLEASERTYKTIFNNIPNPVFVLDADDLTILDCNGSVTAVYGYQRDDILNTGFANLFLPADRPHHIEQIRRLSPIRQVKQPHRNGRIVFTNIRVSPAHFADRAVLLVTTSDITKQLEAEQQLIQAGKMATVGEMATGVAHELNQPLSVIKTASSFCLKKMSGGGTVTADVLTKMLEKIDSNVDRAERIITHLRQFARKSDLDLEQVPLNTALQRALDIFSQQLKLHGIEVKLDLDPRLPPIMGDAGRLEQVFINILVNARDAIEERHGSDPSGAHKRITLTTRRSGTRVQVTVTDTGPGIPSGIRDKIFEPFFTTKEVGKGTGLGLSITYGIIKDLHGDIAVENVRGGYGTRFRITFPVAANHNRKEASGRIAWVAEKTMTNDEIPKHK